MKTCTWHAGTNAVNANVTDGVLSATRKAYGVIRAVETTVCLVPVILEEIDSQNIPCGINILICFFYFDDN